MKHKVKVTVLDTKLYPEYQQRYCANSCSGRCPVYTKGDEFIFYRDGEHDDFWHCGLNTLVKTDGNPDETAGRSEVAVLLRSVGRHFTLHLHRIARRLHHERVDARGEHNDCLLQRRHASRHLQNRKN